MTTEQDTDRYWIEGGDDTHNWDSEYVGGSDYSLDGARTAIEELRQRADSDPAEAGLCCDGMSWRGWKFRITDGDGACC